MAFCDGLLSLSVMLARFVPTAARVMPCCGWITSHGIDMPHFICSLIIWWTFGFALFGWYKERFCEQLCTSFLWTHVLISLGDTPGTGIAGLCGYSVFSLLMSCWTVFQVAIPCAFLPAVYEVSKFSTSSSAPVTVWLVVAVPVCVKQYLILWGCHFCDGVLCSTECFDFDEAQII